MSISIVCGHPGNGKGVLAMALLEQAVGTGRPCFTNIRLNPACPFEDRVALLDDDEDLFPVAKEGWSFWHYVPERSFVLVDEADYYFDCTDHSKLGRDVRHYHKLHRKLRHDVVYVVQNVKNFYVRIRRMCQRFIICEWNWRTSPVMAAARMVMGNSAMRLSRFHRSDFSDERFTPSSHMRDGYISYKEATRYFGWYNTDQIIGDSGWVGARRKASEIYGLSQSDSGANGKSDVNGGVGTSVTAA